MRQAQGVDPAAAGRQQRQENEEDEDQASVQGGTRSS
jgi:hypothetical protein